MKLYSVNAAFICVNSIVVGKVIYLEFNDIMIHIYDDLYFTPRLGKFIVLTRQRNFKWALDEIE